MTLSNRHAVLTVAGLVAAVFTSAALSAAVSAQTVIGLADGKTLVMLDGTSGKVGKTVPVSGAANLIGIDVRPADGMLYGVTADGAVVTIDPLTGKAMEKSKLRTMLPNGVTATVDFNRWRTGCASSAATAPICAPTWMTAR